MLKPLTERDHAYWHANVKLIALCLREPLHNSISSVIVLERV